jgi:RNA polymerase sigma factor (sigma-70 family)
MNDHELLQQYAEHGSHEAFRTLAERYTPLVYSSAYRRVQDESLAEDIVQAVFIILAQKARKVAKHRNLAGWLVNTAKHVSFRAARDQRRRKQREKTFQEMKNMEKKSQEKDRVWQELRPVLDSAIDCLSSKEKTAILLRYFRSYSYVRIGKELDVSENTATKRVERALEKMRKIVAKKRIKVTSVLLGSILASKAVEAVPSGLAASCTDVALRTASGAGIGAAESYTIAKGTMKIMMWAKIKTAAAVIAGVILTGAGGAVGVRHLAVAQEASSKQVKEQTGTMLPEESPVTTRSYWRYWYTYGPPRALVKGELIPQAYRLLTGWGGSSYNQGTTEPPPEKWADPDFDDSAWPVLRMPFNMVQNNICTQHMIRQSYFRTRFIVPDPGRIRKLTFTALFHGGLAVWVNGRELGRKHIPSEGIFAEEGFAEPFPKETWGPVGEEEKKRALKLKIGQRRRGGKVKWLWSYMRMKRPEHKEIAQGLRKLTDRHLKVEVPPEALRKGLNVLTLELRLSPSLYRVDKMTIPHGVIRFVTLDADPDDAVRSADKRPDGVQVWAEDIHRRVLSQDFLEPGVRARQTLRLVGARGSRHSCQVLVGTARDLAKPSAKLGNLSGPSGAAIPATAVSLRWGRPIDLGEVRLKKRELQRKKNGREGDTSICMTVLRYRQPVWAQREKSERLKYPLDERLWLGFGGMFDGRRKADRDLLDTHSKGLKLFDRLSGKAPERIAAGDSQSLWITVDVPADAKPGLYIGKLTVSARGMKTASLPVRLQVFDWKVPHPKEFKIYAGIEQCPWALAKSTGVELWSNEHWKLMEESIKLCGKLGSRVCSLAAVQNSEVDNGNDTMVKWVKSKAGGYTYDFSIADRYLKLWRKHCHPQSDVIVYILSAVRWVRSRFDTKPGTVVVTDPATGAESTLTPIGKEGGSKGIGLWVDFCKAIRGYLNARGFPDKHIVFGMFHDKVGEVNRTLINALAKELPNVGWARNSHYGGKKGMWAAKGDKQIMDRITWDLAVRSSAQYGAKGAPFTLDRKRVTVDGKRRYEWDYQVLHRKGWKNPQAGLNNPFGDNDVICFDQPGALWPLRSYPDMLMTTVYRGFANMLLDGYERCPVGWGPSVRWLVYPTKREVDTSVLFEILREGLQEAEARMFIEDRARVPEDVLSLLDRRAERAWHLSLSSYQGFGCEFYQGWQGRSWDLFAAAARMAGGKVPGEEEKKRFFGK